MTHVKSDDADADSEEYPMLRRRIGDQPSSMRTFGIALAIVSLVGSIFTAGYNWRSVSIIEGNQEKFVKRDVQDEQFKNVYDRLGDIKAQLKELGDELRALRRKE